MTALACVSHYLCLNEFRWAFEINLSLVSIAVVFPLTYNLQEGNRRRERVLDVLTSVKSNVISCFFIFRDNAKQKNGDVTYAHTAGRLLKHFLFHSLSYLTFAYSDVHQQRHALRTIYGALSTLSLHAEKYCISLGYSKPGEAGSSRLNTILANLAGDFEKLRLIRDYRTPSGLRKFSSFALHLLPIALGPKYAYETLKNCAGQSWGCIGAGYYLAILFTLLITTFYNICQELEDPTDGNSADDIALAKAIEEVEMIMDIRPTDEYLTTNPGDDVQPEMGEPVVFAYADFQLPTMSEVFNRSNMARHGQLDPLDPNAATLVKFPTINPTAMGRHFTEYQPQQNPLQGCMNSCFGGNNHAVVADSHAVSLIPIHSVSPGQ